MVATAVPNRVTNNYPKLKKVVTKALQDDPDPANHGIVTKLNELFELAKQRRRGRINQWNKNYKVIRNKTWPNQRTDWMPAPEVPEIFPIIASAVGWCTDQRPTFECRTASEPGTDWQAFYGLLSQDLQTCMQTSWVINNIDGEVEKMIWDGYVYGTGIIKTVWDQALVDGLGDAILRRVDPYSFYPDPDTPDMAQGSFFCEATIVSLQELDRRFPGSAKYFSDGQGYTGIDQRPDLDNTDTIQRRNPGAISNPSGSFGQPVVDNTTGPRFGPPGADLHMFDSIGVTLYEFWVREHYMEDDLLKDTWRCIVMAGNRILFNKPADEIWEHGQHPYERFVLHDTGEFWGISMVELLAPCQIAINRLLAALQHNTELTGNPVFLEDINSGIARTHMTNRPGQRIPKQRGTEAGWINPPEPSAMAFQLVEFYVMEMERISGLTAMARGMAPGGRVAGDVLNQVQDASFVRVRMVLRNIERTLRQAGNKYASLICEFYDEPRVVQIVGPATGEQTSLGILQNHFYDISSDERLPLRFQILVDTGSMLASARPARIAEADALFAMQAIDIEAVLDAHNFPNRAIVGARQEAKLKEGWAAEIMSKRQSSGRKS